MTAIASPATQQPRAIRLPSLPYWGLLSIFCLIPAENAVHLFASFVPPLETFLTSILDGRQSIVWLIGVLSAATWLLYVGIGRARLYLPGTVVTCLVVYTTFAILSLSWATDQSLGIVSLRSLIAKVLFFVLIINLVRTRARLDVALTLYYIATIVAGIFLLFHTTTDITLTRGRLAQNTNPNNLGQLFAMAMLMGPYIVSLTSSKWRRVVLASGMPVLFVALVATGSITNIVGLLLSFAVGGVILAFRYRTKIFLSVAVAFCGIVVVIAFAQTQGFIPARAYDRIANFGGTFGAISSDGVAEIGNAGLFDERAALWEAGITLAEQSWFIGVGTGQYNISYGRLDQNLVRKGRDSHSTYIKLISEVGIIGLGTFFILVVVISRHLWKFNKHLMAVTGIMVLLTTLIFGITHTNLYDDALWLSMGIGTVIPAILRSESRANNRPAISI